MKYFMYVCTLLVAMISGVANAATPINLEGGQAIQGYDTVAYFTEGKPVKGDANISAEYQGATWLFSQEKHKTLFVANPEKYAPQYGGYCAYAAANDALVEIDPTAWDITDGKLFLNYNDRVQKNWLKKKDFYVSKADSFWSTLK